MKGIFKFIMFSAGTAMVILSNDIPLQDTLARIAVSIIMVVFGVLMIRKV